MDKDLNKIHWEGCVCAVRSRLPSVLTTSDKNRVTCLRCKQNPIFRLSRSLIKDPNPFLNFGACLININKIESIRKTDKHIYIVCQSGVDYEFFSDSPEKLDKYHEEMLDIINNYFS